MGRILDKVLGGGGKRSAPRGEQLGLSTPANWSGNTVMGPAGGYASHFGTTRADGRVTNVRSITANDYKAAPSTPKGRSLLGGGGKPATGKPASGGPKKSTGSGRPNGSTLGVRSGTTTAKSYSSAGPAKSTSKKAAGGLIEGSNEMKKMKRMNMGGLPSQADASMMSPGLPTARPGRPTIPGSGPMIPGAPMMKGRADRMESRIGKLNDRMANRTERMTSRMEGADPEKKARIAARMEAMKSRIGDKIEKVKGRMSTGLGNAASRRTGNLERFKSKMEGMASNPKFADIIAKKQKMIDSFKARIPSKPASMKAGGMVRGAGCATRGKKLSKKMG